MARRKGVDDESRKFKISLPNQENSLKESTEKTALDHSSIYKNYENNTDIAIQSFKDSLRILTVLNGVDSPSEYKYDIEIPPNSEIKKNKNGGITILNTDGQLVVGISPPWAIDKKGKVIPTHYEIRDNSIVQVVEHIENNPDYPVVADPWIWRDLIDYAKWVRKNEGWTLSVKPTFWARVNNEYYPALAGWEELYSKYKNQGLNFNLNSMKNQYICHPLSKIAVVKSTWNLDEWRPDVGLWRTMLKKCNP